MSYFSKSLKAITLCYFETAKLAIAGSSRPEVFCKKGVHRNLKKITGKHLFQSLFLNIYKGVGLRPATLLKKRFWHRRFPVNFVKFLKAGLYDEIFLSRVVKFFFRQFPFNIQYVYTAAKCELRFFKNEVFQKKNFLPDFW